MATGEGTDDTLHSRIPGSGVKLWLLLGASRYAVAVGGLAVFFLALIGLAAVDPTPLPSALGGRDPIETTFQAFLTAIITGVTLVVTINQLVLSQELGAVGDQRERMAGAIDFREEVAEVLDRPASPPEPAAFLRALVNATAERAETVSETAGASGHTAANDDIAAFADEIRENAETVADRLENAQFGTFDVVHAALGFNYSLKLQQARRLRAESEGELQEALDELVSQLRLFGPAREHVKTLYFQWELIDLSRAMLYAAGPALVVSAGAVLYLGDPGTVTGSTLGVANLAWVVAAAATVAVAPFALLAAYILRIATVAKRTLAIGPFVLRETDDG